MTAALAADVDSGVSRPQGFRWAYEAAVEHSALKPLTRLVLFRIAARADARTGMIPARFMPSEASLAAATGMSERAVRNHLHAAEAAGWLVIEHRPGRKSAFALTLPGTPDVADAVTIDTPADLPAAPVDNAHGQAPEPPPTPAPRAGVPRHEVPPSQTPAQTETVNGSDRRSLYVRSNDPPDRREQDKILGAFHRGHLAASRADVPDCRPSAVAFADLCRRCGGTCRDRCRTFDEPGVDDTGHGKDAAP